MASVIKYLIEKQPNFLKKTFYKIIPFKYRYGKKYNETRQFLRKSKSWSYDQALNFQFSRLKELLNYSYSNVPYYKKLFDEIGFNPEIKEFSDIKKIPPLTKQIINENFESLVSQTYDKKKYLMHTSGTSGKRLSIYGTDDLFKVECAFIDNAYLDQGAKLYEDHSIWIRRYAPSENDPIFFKDYELNRTYMSAFHLNKNTVRSYVDYINNTKSKILVSYPSTVYFLAKLCLENDLKLPFLQFIHGASEVCQPQWENIIFQAFGIKIKMHYGQVEKVCFAHQDSEDELYKENLLYGYMELDESNSIIGTGFYNEVMPLIRYKTEDVVEQNPYAKLFGPTPKTIKKILGRNTDMLLSSTDALIPGVNFYSFLSKIESIDCFQIEQIRENKKTTLFISPNQKYNALIEESLFNEMKYRLGDIEIDILKKENLKKDESYIKYKTIRII